MFDIHYMTIYGMFYKHMYKLWRTCIEIIMRIQEMPVCIHGRNVR